MCFKEKTKVEDLQNSPWINELSPLTLEERMSELGRMCTEKQKYIEKMLINKRQRKEKILEYIENSTNLISQRGTQ